jgi:hypothetical protein
MFPQLREREAVHRSSIAPHPPPSPVRQRPAQNEHVPPLSAFQSSRRHSARADFKACATQGKAIFGGDGQVPELIAGMSAAFSPIAKGGVNQVDAMTGSGAQRA